MAKMSRSNKNGKKKLKDTIKDLKDKYTTNDPNKPKYWLTEELDNLINYVAKKKRITDENGKKLIEKEYRRLIEDWDFIQNLTDGLLYCYTINNNETQ